VNDKKYMTLSAIREATKDEEYASIEKIKKFYPECTKNYLIYLKNEGSITLAIDDRYGLLPSGEEFISQRDEINGLKSEISDIRKNKWNIVAAVAAVLTLIATLVDIFSK